MTTWSFYKTDTGLFTGGTYSGALLKENTPDGCLPIEGRFDHLSQRVDLVIASKLDAVLADIALLADAEDMAAEKLAELNIAADDLRLQLVTGYQPPAPDEQHEWNVGSRRWALRKDIAQARAAEVAARVEIEALERLQIRSISALLADPTDAVARENFNRRKARIDSLRAITVSTDTTSPAG